jgi:hypothetical protein
MAGGSWQGKASVQRHGIEEDDKRTPLGFEFKQFFQCPTSKFEKVLFWASTIYETF